MSPLKKGLLLVAGASVLTGCASNHPVNSTPIHSASADTPAQQAAAPGTATSAVPKGYRRVVKKGTEYFCRTEPVTGSHTLKNEVCLTPEEFEAERTHRVTAGLNQAPLPAQVGGSTPGR